MDFPSFRKKSQKSEVVRYKGKRVPHCNGLTVSHGQLEAQKLLVIGI